MPQLKKFVRAFFFVFIYAITPVVSVAQEPTVHLIDEAINDWDHQCLEGLEEHEYQLLASMLYCLFREAQYAYYVQNNTMPFFEKSFQSYAALNEHQDASMYLTELVTCCENLIPLQRELFAWAQLRESCGVCCQTYAKEQQCTRIEQAMDALKLIGSQLVSFSSHNFGEHIDKVNQKIGTEINRMIELLVETGDLYNTINDEARKDDDQNENYDLIVRLYTLRDIAAQCIKSTWGSAVLHRDTTQLHLAFVELSSYIFYSAYKAAYQRLSPEHRVLIIGEFNRTDWNIPTELPNPVTFVSEERV